MAWEKGQSGNPAGGKIGARRKLAEAFLEDVQEDWKESGKAVLAKVRETDPSTYLRVVASILPKEIELDVGGSVVELLALVNDARRKQGTPEAPVGMEPSGADTIRH